MGGLNPSCHSCPPSVHTAPTVLTRQLKFPNGTLKATVLTSRGTVHNNRVSLAVTLLIQFRPRVTKQFLLQSINISTHPHQGVQPRIKSVCTSTVPSIANHWNGLCGSWLSWECDRLLTEIPLPNCDLNIKQAAAATLKLVSVPQAVTWVVDLGQTAAVNNAEVPFRYRWCESEENVQNAIAVVKAVIKYYINHLGCHSALTTFL